LLFFGSVNLKRLFLKHAAFDTYALKGASKEEIKSVEQGKS